MYSQPISDKDEMYIELRDIKTGIKYSLIVSKDFHLPSLSERLDLTGEALINYLLVSGSVRPAVLH